MDSISVPGALLLLAGRLVLATALGAVIGANRELQLKPAGLRTHALVSLAACLLTIVGLLLSVVEPAGDPSAPGRVIQGIVAGIGFIGGGVILHRDEMKDVHGLTTAASILVVAALGIAVGAGLWRSATIGVVLTMVVLTLGEGVDAILRRWHSRR